MFGEELKKMMNNKDISLTKFKNITGISAGYMGDLQKNRYLPSKEKLYIIIEALHCTETEKKLLLEEWALTKSGDSLRNTVTSLKHKNENMLNVLKNVKKETELMSEMEKLNSYKKMYDLFFGDLDTNEAKELLKTISEKLEIIALRKNRYEEAKEKIKQLKDIVDSIE